MLDYASQEELQDIISDYDSVTEFVSHNKNIAFYKFDHYIAHKLSLFLVHETIDLKAIKATVDYINHTMPYLVSIFTKPIIHLKEVDEIVPIEMVHKIGNDTMTYAGVHTELWDNFTALGVQPRKLLTQLCDNNYRIYENQIFAQTVDDVLHYLRCRLREIRNLLFVSGNFNINILEKLDHPNYYTAVGKLHSGYIRNFNDFYTALPLNIDIAQILAEIQGYLKFNVYKYNARRKKRLQLKLTNILKMQKNYHAIYLLAKKLNLMRPKKKQFAPQTLQKFERAYFHYCIILLLFTLSHFDFNTTDATKVNFRGVNAEFTNQGWHVQVKQVTSNQQSAILLSVKKDRQYKILLVPQNITSDTSFVYDKRLRCQEIVYLSPFSSNKTSLYVSITDFDSFLRLQQLIFKAMVYADSKHKKCPFCGRELVADKTTKNVWTCPVCRTRIQKCKCPETNKYYYTTAIDGLHLEPSLRSEYLDRYGRSKNMHYRNITDITAYGEAICPACDKIHG
ncbi:MAG: hypothetical protein MJ206_00300 [Bacilli bacterium]|nr:hypothetical protein [Bacilli bacterium]